MANNDLLTRLLLDSKNFDTNLAKSTKQVQNFKNMSNKVGSTFSSGLGVLTKFAPQLAAITGGFAAFNAAINSSQKMQDGFNIVMAQGTGVVNSFFTHLATGNFSTFTSGLQEVVNKAREAYEALDDLESFSVRATPEMNIIDDKMQNALEKARTARIEGNKKMYEEQLNLARVYYADYEKLAKLEAEKKLNSAGTYLNKELANFDVEMTNDELKYYFSGSHYKEVNALAEEYDKYNNQVDKLNELKNKRDSALKYKRFTDYYRLLKEVEAQQKEVDKYDSGIIDQMKKAYAATQIDDGKDEFKQSMENVRAVDAQTVALERKGNMIEKVAAKEIAANNKIAASKGGKETSSLSYKGTSAGILEYGSIAYYEQQLSKWKEVYRNAGEEKARAEAKAYMDKYQEILNGFNPKAPETIKTVINEEFSDNEIASMINMMGQLGSSFNKTGATGAQAFANIASSIVPLIGKIMALTVAEGELKAVQSSSNWVEAIAATIAVAGTIAGTFAAYKDAGKYATGGIVGGSSYSGDNMLAHVNSGEMILNRNQQANLFNLLDGKGSVSSNQVEFKLRGQELIGLIKNSSNRNSKLL